MTDEEFKTKVLVALAKIEDSQTSQSKMLEAHDGKIKNIEVRLNGNGSFGISTWIEILKWGGAAIALIILAEIAPTLLKRILPLI